MKETAKAVITTAITILSIIAIGAITVTGTNTID